MHDAPPASDPASGRAKRRPRIALRIALALVLYPLVLFLPAGRLDWVEGWVFLALLVALGGAGSAVLKTRHPDLVAERARFTKGEGIEPWDRILAPAVGILGPLATYVVAGLDVRFGWTGPLPLAVSVFGAAAITAGSALGLRAMAENRFFSSVVRIQAERGHVVVEGGPYRFVRHPGYAGGLVATLGVPLLLGSITALAPAVLTAGAIVLRTALEDRVLGAALPGYGDYAARVRWRLVPGIW